MFLNGNEKIMKTQSSILILFLALIAGFAIAWFVKPIINGSDKTASPVEMNAVHDHQGESMDDAGEQIYTCSMHPQIRQNEPGSCPICGMDLIPLTSNTSNDPLVLEMTEEAVKLAQIQTQIVGQGVESTGKAIRLSGKVKVDERRTSAQVAHVPGRIEKLYVTFTGEKVSTGQKLADLYAPELISAQRELLEAQKLKDINPGLLEAARNKLRFWKIGNATIESIEKNGTIQEIFSLYAQAPGVVSKRRVSVGDYVQKGQALFDLIDLNNVWVVFDAYEEDLANISVGNRISFTTSSHPTREFKSRVTFIDPMIDPQTRVAAVRTEVRNTSGLLKPEMFVSGELSAGASGKTQLLIPKSAILWTGRRSVVYVKLPENEIPSFQYREVELGERMGNSYQIVSGLESGEEIVVNGSFAIDASAQLNNQASMMNKDVLIKKMEEGDQLPDFTVETPAEFKDQLSNLANAYLKLKDALVDTDTEIAGREAEKMQQELAEVNMALLPNDPHIYWMKQLEALQIHGDKIVTIKNVEEQRKQFEFLSEALIKALKVFGVSDETYFVQHCPMASNNRGADWISDAREIRNPYFGDKMLTCGTVKDTIEGNLQ